MWKVRSGFLAPSASFQTDVAVLLSITAATVVVRYRGDPLTQICDEEFCLWIRGKVVQSSCGRDGICIYAGVIWLKHDTYYGSRVDAGIRRVCCCSRVPGSM